MSWLEAAAKILSPIRPQRVRMAPKILDTADTLRGGVQPAGDLLRQLQGKPGITAEAGATELLIPNAKRITDVRDSSKAKFYQDIYDKTLEKDLYQPLSEQGIPVSLDNGYWRIGLPEDVRNSIKDESGILNYAEGGSVRSSPSVIDLIRNDPELQALPKNILKSLLNFGRGSVAALGGIGGDMTALGGTLLGNEVTGHGDTFLPTTSDLLRRLPQLPDDWKDYEVQQAGTFDPGIVPTALPKLGGAMARLGAEAIHQGTHGAGPLRDILRAAAPLSVIKPKGGNWLAGSVEDALRGLKKEGFTREQLVAMRDARLGKQTNGLNAYGEPLEDVDLIQELRARPEYRNLPPSYAQQAMLSAPQASINSWIEGPLTKYVKTRMASPDDEVRKLAEQGVLHFEPLVNPVSNAAHMRVAAGYPAKGEAKTHLGGNWENLADEAVRIRPASYFQQGLSDVDPWLLKAAPDTKVYDLEARGLMSGDLGFPHLIDELSNALNPASGLPRNLQLTPEAMQNMSMEKAVRHVHEINQFRKAAMEQARLKELETSGMLGTTRREYAENNPMGLRWVEYTRPEKLHEGVTNIAKHGDEYVALGADGQPIAQRLPDGSTGRLATGKTPEDAHLAGQLITEGNIMGHCVGGYCEDVASGRSRIFSLKDKKGEPHVTIEVSPQPRNQGQQDIPDRYVEEAMERMGIDSPEAQWGREEEIDKLAGDLWRKDNPDVQRIVQVKGKQNRKPNDEYLPFVQDFVRNNPLGGAWGDVGDLGNTGLVTIPKGKTVTMDGRRVTLPEGYQSLESLRNLLSHPDIHPELSDAQAEALYDKYLRGNNYAEGGSVSKNSLSVADLGRIIEQLSRSQ